MPSKKTTKKKAKKAVKKTVTKKRVAKKTSKKAAKKTTKKVAVRKRKNDDVRKRAPLGHLLVEQLLREVGFAGRVSTNKELLNQYSTDESIFAIRPQIVLQPKSSRDIELTVQVLSHQTERFPSLSITPRAAGTGLSGGSLTDSVVMDVCKYLHHIEEPEKRGKDLYITCEPGAMLRDVEKKLKKVGHYLPASPASKDICAIGGCVANNSAGADSLRYGHFAESIASLDVALHDGLTYTLKPITYKEFKTLTKKDTALAHILTDVFGIIERNESSIQKARPKTKKNSAGYAIWDVLDGSVASFKRGKSKMDLTRLIAGSQGTVGVISKMTLKAEPINQNTDLIVVPVFDLLDAGAVIKKAISYDPVNVELFDGLSFDLALKNPGFFKDRLSNTAYYRVLLAMYTLYHVRWMRKTPEFVLLITIEPGTKKSDNSLAVVEALKHNRGKKARLITSPTEAEMFWQIRRASYSLSKFQDPNKRPAAFLEDMTVPPENLAKFFIAIKKLLKKYNITAAVHGHGGNGHLHFYPLLDFTKKGTDTLVEKMSEEFFAAAVKFDGNICGEHNDGIIRTPHLNKMFSAKILGIFEQLEHIFDPEDIFNPGKKVNPRFSVKENLRHTN